MWLITFDIDGTMEFGDPNGILTREHVEYFRAQGAVVGSASDRPESSQLIMWRGYGLEPDFVILKHHMPVLKERYPDAATYWHVGDRPLDQQTAHLAGFTFFWPDQFPSPEMGGDFFPHAKAPEEGGSMTIGEAAQRLAAHALDVNANTEHGASQSPGGSGHAPGHIRRF